MIELTPEQQKFVDAQIAIGLFKEPSEVVQAGIDLLRKAAELREYNETVEDIRQGIEDHNRGKGQPLAEAFDDIRGELGLPK